MARLTATRKLTSHGQNLHGRLSAIAGARRRLIAECSEALISNGKTGVELSTIEGGGLGLFAVEPLPSGSIVAFYPGLVWQEDDLYLDTPVDEHALPVPSFTINNSYLLRSRDPVGKGELIVDGRPFGPSAGMFRKAAALRGWSDVDCSWLEGDRQPGLIERLLQRDGPPTAPLAHLINHAEPAFANVVVDEEPIQLSASELAGMPEAVRRRMPTVAAAALARESWVASLASLVPGFAPRSSAGGGDGACAQWLFTFRAATDIAKGTELTWSYGKDPLKVGWRPDHANTLS